LKGLLTYRTIQISMSMSHLCETEILSYLLLKLNLAGSGFGLAFPIWGDKKSESRLNHLNSASQSSANFAVKLLQTADAVKIFF